MPGSATLPAPNDGSEFEEFGMTGSGGGRLQWS